MISLYKPHLYTILKRFPAHEKYHCELEMKKGYLCKTRKIQRHQDMNITVEYHVHNSNRNSNLCQFFLHWNSFVFSLTVRVIEILPQIKTASDLKNGVLNKRLIVAKKIII